jgi:hypothetical protein
MAGRPYTKTGSIAKLGRVPGDGQRACLGSQLKRKSCQSSHQRPAVAGAAHVLNMLAPESSLCWETYSRSAATAAVLAGRANQYR